METFHGSVTSPADALILFEACRLNRLKRVQRRLAESERLAYVKSGAVFVWDEEESGIKRWTDGKHWSPSRINGSFLIYREVEPRRRLDSNPSANPAIPPCIEYVIKEHGLTKKAISITTSDGRKQHLVSYYTREDINNDLLPSPALVSGLGDIIVEKDIYPEFMPDGPAGSSASSMRTGDTASVRSTGSGGSGAGAPAYTRGPKTRRVRNGNGSVTGVGGDDVSLSSASLADHRLSSVSSFEHPDVRFSHDSGVSIYSKWSGDDRSVRSMGSSHDMAEEELGGISAGDGGQSSRHYGVNHQGFISSPSVGGASVTRRVHRSPSIQSTPADFSSSGGTGLRRTMGGRTPSVHSLPIDAGVGGSNCGISGGGAGRGERTDFILPLPHTLSHSHHSHTPLHHQQQHSPSQQQQSSLPPPMFLAHSNWTPDTDYGRRLLEGHHGLGGQSNNSSNASSPASSGWTGPTGQPESQRQHGGDAMDVDSEEAASGSYRY